MSKIKFQHYVPRFYLKQFSNKTKGNNFFIYCYDKKNSRIFFSNINRVGGKKHYYDDSGSPFKPMEKILTNIESKYQKTHKKLLKFEDLNTLSFMEVITTGIFLVTQELRTPEFREYMKSIVNGFKIVSEEKGWQLSDDLKQQVNAALKEEKLKEYQISMFDSISDFVFMVVNMKWVLIKNKTDYPLWTSDNPITRWNPNDLSPFGNMGFLSRGIEIHFPLSPDLSLCICDPVQYAAIPSTNDAIDNENVVFQNWLQVSRSTRFLYSKINDFSLADKILLENPGLREPTRPRVQVT